MKRARRRHSKAEVAEIAQRANAMHDAGGCTWDDINAALGYPYVSGMSLTSALRFHYQHGDDPDPAAMAEEEDAVSVEWATSPPPDSELWTDDRWLRTIRTEAKRRIRARETI